MSLLLLCATLGSQAHGGESPVTALKQIATPDRHTPQTAVRSLGGSQHTIRMQQGSFTLDPAALPQLTTPSGYLLLQLNAPLTEEWRRQLEGLGVSLLEYIPDNTWSSRVSRDRLEAVRALPFVRALGRIYPSDKLPASLLTHDLSPRALQGETLTLDVSFHPDQPFGAVMSLLRPLGAATEQGGFGSGQQLRLTLPAARLADLASLDAVRWIEEPAAPIAPENTDSARLIGVTALQQQLPGLEGSGVLIGGWESGTPQTDHPDLAGRITIAQGGTISSHATHVAGTLIGSGKNNAQARGMAPQASYLAYDFYGDIPGELGQAAVSYGIQLSNHSWGYMAGWTEEYYGSGWTWFGNPNEQRDSDFGRYSSLTQSWDRHVERYGTIVVKSAGNNRNDYGVPAGRPHHHYGDSVTLHYDSHAPDGGYDTMELVASAKNIITVGAVDDGGAMTSFSGWGPADDGRVKPDLVANGTGVLSTVSGSGYGTMSGTSMATPAVTGTLALISELYGRYYPGKLGAATAKAILIHTASDRGAAGPDYQYGWGLVNANGAARLLLDDQGSGQQLIQTRIDSGAEQLFPLQLGEASSELRATLVWNDLAASPGAAVALVNDLDLELIAPDGTLHHPFTLGGLADPAAPARQDRANRVDNVEQVVVKSAQPGQWQIRVRGYRVHGSQGYTLISTRSVDGGVTKAIATSNDTTAPSSGGGGSLGLLALMALAAASLLRRPQ